MIFDIIDYLVGSAVCTYLAALERDGLVAQSGLRWGVGKPAYTYVLTRDLGTFGGPLIPHVCLSVPSLIDVGAGQ